MRLAVCPGSFDPVTKGHIDIIKRASKLFDKVIIVVSVNASKVSSFSLQERVEMIKLCTTDIENVEVDVVTELLASYVERVGACAIVKGLRALSDFEYEFQMALANKKLNPEAETLFLTTAAENMYLSSSIVKQIAGFGGDISDFVPTPINQIVLKRFQKANNIGGNM
ncbi:MAG: pantetheine-phosphate adenylyltransferase [Oscillospiraceae bacterium]